MLPPERRRPKLFTFPPIKAFFVPDTWNVPVRRSSANRWCFTSFCSCRPPQPPCLQCWGAHLHGNPLHAAVQRLTTALYIMHMCTPTQAQKRPCTSSPHLPHKEHSHQLTTVKEGNSASRSPAPCPSMIYSSCMMGRMGCIYDTECNIHLVGLYLSQNQVVKYSSVPTEGNK